MITGVPVIPVGGVPTDRPLPVTAQHGEWGWDHVRISLRDEPVVATRALGSVIVDYARFMLADAEALSFWIHDHPVDGLADVVFRGKDEDAIAAEFDAPRTGTPGEDGYGWLNLPIREFPFDFRPHSHPWQVMADVRASDHEAATIEVGGARVMMAMTSIGDGVSRSTSTSTPPELPSPFGSRSPATTTDELARRATTAAAS